MYPAQPKWASSSNTVQLVKNITLSRLTATANQKYFVNSSAPHELYSKKHVPPPRPKGLYKRTDVSYEKNKFMYGWIPNVRFLNEQEKGVTSTRAANGTRSLQYRGQSSFFGMRSGATHTFDLAGEKRKLENPRKSALSDRLPTMGVLGKNDCGYFATALQNIIAREEPRLINKE